MKNIAILTFICVSMVFQKTNGQGLEGVGIKSGVSFSTQNWFYTSPDFEIKHDYRKGLPFSINLEWLNNDYVSLLTDVGFIRKGYKNKIMMTTPDNPESGTLKTFYSRFDYLYFSPQLKVRKAFNAIIPFAFAGPRIDYLLAHKSYADLSAIDKDFRTVLFGLNYGLGITYKIREFGISMELTNFYDFTNMMHTQPTQNNAGLRIKNNTYTLVFGISYYLKGKDK